MMHKHLFCEICKTQTNCGATTFCRWHLKKHHPEYDTKKYYDDFIIKEKEGLCDCGNKTNFLSFNLGYNKSCSKKCSSNLDSIKEKIKNTKINKYGSLNNFEKAKQTIRSKYNVENISQIPLIKEKKKLTCFKNFGVENPLQSEIIKEKSKNTLLNNYGVDNISKHPDTNNKRKITTQKRYGVPHYSKSAEYRKFCEENKIWIPLEDKSEFEKYCRLVWSVTKKYKKQLFFNWDGNCYYTNEKLNKNVNYNNLNFPVIDHKISVYFGFKNNIDYKIIGGLDNLCICSRMINRKKEIMCENEFKLILKN